MQFSIDKNNNLLFSNKDLIDEKVLLKQCFPQSNPEKFILVQKENGEEIFILDNIKDLEISSYMAIQEKITNQGFQFEITKIFSIDEEYGIRNWSVETASGKRTFQTSIQEWPKRRESLVVVTDLNADIYQVDLTKLERTSLEIIGTYVD